MSRVALTAAVVCATVGLATTALAVDPHMDPTLLPMSCNTCHAGHGQPGSPMLPEALDGVCLSCHGGQGERDKAGLQGRLAPHAHPQPVASALSQPFTHPMTDAAFSRFERGVVTCTSCHSPHRGSRGTKTRAAGARKLSTLDPRDTEFELCAGCHGGTGPKGRDPREVSHRASPANPSYHPLQAPTVEGSPSVRPDLAGREIDCTDCHGNNDPAGLSGPHGSSVRYLLRADYTSANGETESETAYALCYRCHDRDRVLASEVFPPHRRHVVGLKVSCATCHDAHGSLDNRALIRFSRDVSVPGVSPSGSTGKLAFESEVQGFGRCYLTCHGYDHAPAEYVAGQPTTVRSQTRNASGEDATSVKTSSPALRLAPRRRER